MSTVTKHLLSVLPGEVERCSSAHRIYPLRSWKQFERGLPPEVGS